MNKKQKIRFSEDFTSNNNWKEEHAINKVETMASIILMHAALICPEDKFSTDIWTMEMAYAAWVYNMVSDIQYGLSTI